MKPLYRYHHIALGGTFDRLHIGHQKLISVASKLASKITIGLTTKEITRNKAYSNTILPYSLRKEELDTFLHKNIPNTITKIIPLKDIYGPTILSTSIEAIVVTPHTLEGANSINQLRVDRGLEALPIHLAPLITDDSGEYISSTRIRAGHINRQGHLYNQIIKKDTLLNKLQLNYLKHPLGKLVKEPSEIVNEISKCPNLYVVGDVVSQCVLDQKINYHHIVFDGKTQRKPYSISSVTPTHYIKNHPGSLNISATKKIQELLKVSKKSQIKVIGEEDLLVLPYILFAPLNSAVIYGQPNEGVVIVDVTEDAKKGVSKLLRKI